MAVPKVDGQFIAEAVKYIDENGNILEKVLGIDKSEP